MLERVIGEFGARLGMNGLELNEQGLLIIDIDNVGRVNLELSENKENLYVYISLPYPPYDDTMAFKVLSLCSYHHGHGIALRGGVYNNWALLLMEFNVYNLSAADLENAIRLLADLIEQVFKD